MILKKRISWWTFVERVSFFLNIKSYNYNVYESFIVVIIDHYTRLQMIDHKRLEDTTFIYSSSDLIKKEREEKRKKSLKGQRVHKSWYWLFSDTLNVHTMTKGSAHIPSNTKNSKIYSRLLFLWGVLVFKFILKCTLHTLIGLFLKYSIATKKNPIFACDIASFLPSENSPHITCSQILLLNFKFWNV